MFTMSIFHVPFSGAVVANRLSEIENWKILLLEAGGDETDISDVPVLAAYLQLSGLDWSYKTEPSSTSCLGESTLHPSLINQLNSIHKKCNLRLDMCGG